MDWSAGGMYTFKTPDLESSYYENKIKEIKPYTSNNIKLIRIKYVNTEGFESTVIVSLSSDCSHIEFDVNAAGIVKDGDLTVNWK